MTLIRVREFEKVILFITFATNTFSNIVQRRVLDFKEEGSSLDIVFSLSFKFFALGATTLLFDNGHCRL